MRKLTFSDLYRIHRLKGGSIWRAVQWAWAYRNFTPDHSGSRALTEQMRDRQRKSEAAYIAAHRRLRS